jgi:hypothetical protein
MALGLSTAAVLLLVLTWEVARPRFVEALVSRRGRWFAPTTGLEKIAYDPGRERRAEQRARELLRSCVNDEEWAMYGDLGFLRVWGGQTNTLAAGEPDAGGDPQSRSARAPYAYLLYPHKPIVAYMSATGELLSEYCVAFPDDSRPFGSPRLPDSDDVLAKWLALVGDERRLIADANMHLPGRQLDPDVVRRDLQRLARWERGRARRTGSRPGSEAVPGAPDGAPVVSP